jgi:hypothetical protein
MGQSTGSENLLTLLVPRLKLPSDNVLEKATQDGKRDAFALSG